MKIEKLLVILLIVSDLVIKLYHNDFFTGQDALTYHLQVTRYIAQNDEIPKIVPYDIYHRTMFKPPLLYLTTAPFFKFFGSNERVAEITPILATFTWLLFLTYWVKKEGGRFEILLLTIFLSFFVLDLMSWFYQGCLVILFSTIAFYYWKEFLDNPTRKNIVLFVIFASLSAFSKITGVVMFGLATLFYFVYLVKYRDLKSILLVLPAFVLIASWYLPKIVLSFKIVYSFSKEGIEHHYGFWLFHTEFILLIAIIPTFYREFQKSEKIMLLFFIPLMLYFLLASIDARYPSFLSGFAIFFVSKYLSKIKFPTEVLNTIFYVVVIIFYIDGLFVLYNPQEKELKFFEANKDMCRLLKSKNVTQANIVGDADFGIAWFCKYNFSTVDSWFLYQDFEPDYFMDNVWLNKSDDKVNVFKETHVLKLIYNKNDIKLYEVVKE